MLEDEEPGEGYCTIFFAKVDNIHHTLKQNIKQYKSYLYTSHNVCSSFLKIVIFRLTNIQQLYLVWL